MRIHKISRRNFMQITGISALAMGLAACGGSSSSTAASSTASPAASSAAGNASYKITIAHQQDDDRNHRCKAEQSEDRITHVG